MTTTNLYLALDEARTWAKARAVPLNLVLTPDGGLSIQGYKAGATPEDQPDRAQWVLSSMDLRKGFGIDPPGSLGEPKPLPGLGAQLRFVLGSPLGPTMLATFLLDDDHDLTKAIVAKAVALRAQVEGGQNIDPWQATLDALEPTPAAPVEMFKAPLGPKPAGSSFTDLIRPRP